MRAFIKLVMWVAGLTGVVLIASNVFLPPSYTVHSEVVIKKSPEEVWERVSSLNQWPSWLKGIERLTVVEGDGRTVGSAANVLVYNGLKGWEMNVRIAETIPNMRLVYDVEGGPQDGVRSTIALIGAEDNRAVRVVWSESQEPAGLWGNVLALVIMSVVSTQHDESLNNLKFGLERRI